MCPLGWIIGTCGIVVCEGEGGVKLKSEQNGSLEDTQCDPLAPGHRVRIHSPHRGGLMVLILISSKLLFKLSPQEKLRKEILILTLTPMKNVRKKRYIKKHKVSELNCPMWDA